MRADLEAVLDWAVSMEPPLVVDVSVCGQPPWRFPPFHLDQVPVAARSIQPPPPLHTRRAKSSATMVGTPNIIYIRHPFII